MKTTDTYDIITDRILAVMEKGIIPWKKEWKDKGSPVNAISKKPYQGINWLLLSCCSFADNRFLTFKQAKDLGGSVKKGEKGMPVVYWNITEKTVNGELKKSAFIKYSTVFNVDQCEGLELAAIAINDNKPLRECESVYAGMPCAPSLFHGGGRAFYRPSEDSVTMPEIGAFTSSQAYYSTLFHELTHSTGHQSRLKRQGILELNGFGSETYSKEELVAELGAAFLCAETGIASENLTENHAAYLQSWIKRLKEDKTLIIKACGEAKKAVSFILGE